MLDIKLIRETPDIVENDLKRRNETEKIRILHDLMKYDKEWRDKIKEVETLRRRRNEITGEVSKAKARGYNVNEAMEEARQIPEKIKEAEARLNELDSFCHNLIMQLPNLLQFFHLIFYPLFLLLRANLFFC